MKVQDFFFIANFVSPIYLMLLFRLKTQRLNLLVPTLFVGSIVAVPLAVYICLTNVIGILYVVYWYIFVVLAYLLRTSYDAPQAISVAAMTVFLSSYWWEIPWLVRNAWITGFEWDWLLHALGLFYLWFLHEAVGFRKNLDAVVALLVSLSISTLYMVLVNIPLGVHDPYVWNSVGFMEIRILSALTVLYSLKVKK